MPKVNNFKIHLSVLTAVCIAIMLYAFIPARTKRAGGQARVLVFTKTNGYHHPSIPAGTRAIQKLGAENNFGVDISDNARYFTQDSLKHYRAVIFLNTTQNVLNADQQIAFERYIQAGGGYVGVHSAADTEYDWPWYNKLLGAWNKNSPKVCQATIDVVDSTNIATSFLPRKWVRTDEWYNYKNIQPDIRILATLDEDSYQGGENGDVHPIAWYHDFDGGRAFYTGGGHTDESYNEPLFLRHLLGGIKYAMGSAALDYSRAYAVKKPEDNRFKQTILSNDLNEPMQLAVANDGRVFFVERIGNFSVYTPKDKKTILVRKFPVQAGYDQRVQNGMLGVTIDPDFDTNNYIYFYFTTNIGEVFKQHLSRFTISKDNALDLKSEKVLLEIPIDAEQSAHAGGGMAWDKNKNLFLSVGDNTTPSASEGYAPLDRRDGRKVYDSERSAGNTNDLRGKILRIHPEADGTYTIPAGNLFPKGTPLSRPEIFVMGCRNPYRITVDQQTSTLYWGDIGPDAGTIGPQGSIGFDEFNQAKTAGFYGWPYLVGDNQPYNEFDFATRKAGKAYDANGPENLSPWNTGAKILPPAHKAMIWYPYTLSTQFPLLGKGTRCAIGGPVYHYDAALKSNTKFPEYYDGVWFIGEFMRNWVFGVRMDKDQNYQRMEPFMETNGDFRRPIDMKFGPDGSFYMLQYGSGYAMDNVDARLVRIDYNAGNRAPVAKITTKDTIGLVPFKVTLNQQSFDPDDEDKLTYKWLLNGKTVISTAAKPVYTFRKNGIYKVTLQVTDQAGKSSSATQVIKVGNTPPQVAISSSANSSFFFADASDFDYKVMVKDREDKIIDLKKVKIHLHYIPRVETGEVVTGADNYNYGRSLMAKSDCFACHQVNNKVLGPAFIDVAKRYAGNKGAVEMLANKVIKGGSGAWGDNNMSAHPQLTKDDATEIVKYVLSLNDVKPEVDLPMQGTVALKEQVANNGEGLYVLSASYTDKGGAITPLTSTEKLVLRPSKIKGADADEYFNIEKRPQGLFLTENRSYFLLKNIDLKGINQLTYSFLARSANNRIEVHADSPRGPLVSTIKFTAASGGAFGGGNGAGRANGNGGNGGRANGNGGGSGGGFGFNRFTEQSVPVTNLGARHDLYFVFFKEPKISRGGMVFNWVNFETKK